MKISAAGVGRNKGQRNLKPLWPREVYNEHTAGLLDVQKLVQGHQHGSRSIFWQEIPKVQERRARPSLVAQLTDLARPGHPLAGESRRYVYGTCRSTGTALAHEASGEDHKVPQWG